MATTRSPPVSPTKKPKSWNLNHILTSTTDSPLQSRRRENSSTASSPSRPAPTAVANLVRAYEHASLSTSRPYSSIPSAPPSPTKSTPARSIRTGAPVPVSPSRIVPASFFQQQSTRSPPPPPTASYNSAPSSLPVSPAAIQGKDNRFFVSPRPSPSKLEVSTPSTSYFPSSSVIQSPTDSIDSPATSPVTWAHARVVEIGPRVAAPQRVVPPTRSNVPSKQEQDFRRSAFVESLFPSPPVREIEYQRPEKREQMMGVQAFAALPMESVYSDPAREAGEIRVKKREEEGDEEWVKVDREETMQEKVVRIEVEFAKLMDSKDLSTQLVRDRMMTLTTDVKERMLLTAAVSSPSRPTHTRGRSLNTTSSTTPSSPTKSPSKFTSFLRKTKSSASLAADFDSEEGSESPAPSTRRSHSRSRSATLILKSLGKAAGAALVFKAPAQAEDAMWWAVRVRSAKCVGVKVADLQIKEVKRLRGILRTEPPSWVDEFIRHGGYLGLLERLKEMLDVEWREEQHDDQMLNAILGCFVALTTSSSGRQALASRAPIPFVSFAALLFSEKRPGDLPCRQLLVELIHSLFDIYPSEIRPLLPSDWTDPMILHSPTDTPSDGRRYHRKMKGGESEESLIDEERKSRTHDFVRTLLMGPPDERSTIMKDAHKERLFKTWLKELSDCLRDYFWTFAHNGNGFLELDRLDPARIESPQVPSGMTGGVENEAMNYCIAHLRLLNTLVATCKSPEAAFKLHDSLFASGIELILLTLRRASNKYYPVLHLELSRYVDSVRSVQFNAGGKILSFVEAKLSPEERAFLRTFQRQAPVGIVVGSPMLGELTFD